MGGEPAAAVTDNAAGRDSLLFSAEVLAAIDAARGRHGPRAAAVTDAPRKEEARSGVLHLSAIVRHGPDDWRVWLNGEPFTVATRRPWIEIVEVTTDAVGLIWRDGAGGERRLRLSPNQTYLAAEDVVVEGLPTSGARRGP